MHRTLAGWLVAAQREVGHRPAGRHSRDADAQIGEPGLLVLDDHHPRIRRAKFGERDVLVIQGGEDGLPHPGEQFAERWLP